MLQTHSRGEAVTLSEQHTHLSVLLSLLLVFKELTVLWLIY
jgi:hypothetical protein